MKGQLHNFVLFLVILTLLIVFVKYRASKREIIVKNQDKEFPLIKTDEEVNLVITEIPTLEAKGIRNHPDHAYLILGSDSLKRSIHIDYILSNRQELDEILKPGLRLVKRKNTDTLVIKGLIGSKPATYFFILKKNSE